MSKQSEAKAAQNYRTTPDTCSNCAHYQSKFVKKVYDMACEPWMEEVDKRCGLGAFAVRKTAVCDRHEGKA